MERAVIVDAVRTPRGKGKPGGALSGIHPNDLLGGVFQELRKRVGFDPLDLDDVNTGCANTVGDHGDNVARLAVLSAGWPPEVPGLTLSRMCGSGQQAVNAAAALIEAKQADLVVGSGVEMMSRYPVAGRLTLDAGNEQLRERFPFVPQGISADLIATLEGFTRADADAFAVESQRRAAVAIAEGRFDKSMVAVADADGAVVLDREELPRASTLAQLGQLKASFVELGTQVFPGYDRPFDEMCREVYPQVTTVEHIHHAGNSSGLADGASAVLVSSIDYAAAHGYAPRARILATAVTAAEPVIMLTAPGPAAQRVLSRAGMTVDDIDLFEVNEAFASVVLKFMRDLKVDHDKVNVNGGAIALGHPIGASGPLLIATVLDELERQDLTTALVTMCTGGGQATATIIERS